jgi:hypothetical protein
MALIRRQSHAAESAVYFCCLEGLQNVAKHAGPDASATMRLSETLGRDQSSRRSVLDLLPNGGSLVDEMDMWRRMPQGRDRCDARAALTM